MEHSILGNKHNNVHAKSHQRVDDANTRNGLSRQHDTKGTISYIYIATYMSFAMGKIINEVSNQLLRALLQASFTSSQQHLDPNIAAYPQHEW